MGNAEPLTRSLRGNLGYANRIDSSTARGGRVAKKKQARKSTPRRHSVKVTLEVRKFSPVGTSLKLVIKSRRKKLGEFEVGQGGVRWWGKYRHTSKRIS